MSWYVSCFYYLLNWYVSQVHTLLNRKYHSRSAYNLFPLLLLLIWWRWWMRMAKHNTLQYILPNMQYKTKCFVCLQVQDHDSKSGYWSSSFMSCVYKQRMGLLTVLAPLIHALHTKLNPRQGIYSYRLLILLSVAGHLSANKVLFGVHLQHSQWTIIIVRLLLFIVNLIYSYVHT